MNCPATGPSGFASEEEAREIIAQRLYVAPGSPAEVRLNRALDEALQEEEDGVWRIKGSQPLQPCIVSWKRRVVVLSSLCKPVIMWKRHNENESIAGSEWTA